MVNRKRQAIGWAIVGGVVVIAGLAALLISTLLNTGDPAGTSTPEPSTPPTAPTEAPAGSVVDPSVAEKGWLPEPITQDPELYAEAAIEAAGTFDTRSATRDEWLDYVMTWFTPEYLFADPADNASSDKQSELILDQRVVLPEDVWDSLAAEQGRVIADVNPDELRLDEVDDEPGVHTYTADVSMTYTRVGDGQEVTYEEVGRVSVQVACNEFTQPAEGSAQQPGDCKVIRWLAEPLE